MKSFPARLLAKNLLSLRRGPLDRIYVHCKRILYCSDIVSYAFIILLTIEHDPPWWLFAAGLLSA